MLYRISRASKEICNHLGVCHANLLARASLPANYLDAETQGIDADTCYRLWQALEDEVKNPTMPLLLGQDRGKQSTSAAVVAFACSKTVIAGLERLALFRSLSAPGTIELGSFEDRLEIKLMSPEPNVRVPKGYFIYSLVYLVEMMRFYSRLNVTPLKVSWPSNPDIDSHLQSYFGIGNSNTGSVELVVSSTDANLPLFSESDSVWRSAAPEFHKQLSELNQSSKLSSRVRKIIMELLPTGVVSAELVSERLHISRRSLQRHLLSEGTSFRTLLDKSRTEASYYYLSHTALSVEEIAYMLGYSSASSFYRAFQKWTNQTPLQVRLGS